MYILGKCILRTQIWTLNFFEQLEEEKVFKKLGEQIKNWRTKCKTVGNQAKGAIIANNVYQAMLKKLENEKWPNLQMIKM